jgi:hypothetical protein
MNRTFIGIVITAVFGFAIRGAAETQTARSSVAGTIVREDNGSPVSKAIVTLGQVSVTTGDDGRFAFLQVNPGEYRLSVRGTGFAPTDYGQPFPPRPTGGFTPIVVEAGVPVSGIVVALTPGAVISGRVVDGDGNPVREAQVEAFQYAYQEGWRVLVSAAPAFEANDRGEFRMFWLAPGSYVLRASPRGDATGTAPAPSYFPGVTDPRAATPVAVASGDTLDITVRMAETRLARIDGTVINGLSGTPVSARVVLAPRNPDAAPRLYRNDTASDAGAFSITGVPPGSYFLYATGASAESRLATRVPLEIGDRDIDALTVEVKPLTVQGRVSVEDWPEGFDRSRAQPRMSVLMRLDPPILEIDELRDGVSSRLQAIVTDGAFRFPSVIPADYRVSMNITVPGFPDPYVKSIRFLDSDVIGDGLRLDNRSEAWLDIVVGLNGASIGGVVLDSRRQPVRRATVVVVPDQRQNVTRFKDTQTDAMGLFQIHGIAPGSYKVFAWESIDSGAWLSADTLSAYDAQATPVLAGEGSRMNTLELQAIRWRPPL